MSGRSQGSKKQKLLGCLAAVFFLATGICIWLIPSVNFLTVLDYFVRGLCSLASLVLIIESLVWAFRKREIKLR
jgi:hypothetical protein